MSDETVMVQPVRTFLEGSDLKHPDSEPYPVSRSRMLDLARNGLVEQIGAATEPEAPSSSASDVQKVEPAAPRKRGRPPKAV